MTISVLIINFFFSLYGDSYNKKILLGNEFYNRINYNYVDEKYIEKYFDKAIVECGDIKDDRISISIESNRQVYKKSEKKQFIIKLKNISNEKIYIYDFKSSKCNNSPFVYLIKKKGKDDIIYKTDENVCMEPSEKIEHYKLLPPGGIYEYISSIGEINIQDGCVYINEDEGWYDIEVNFLFCIKEEDKEKIVKKYGDINIWRGGIYTRKLKIFVTE